MSVIDSDGKIRVPVEGEVVNNVDPEGRWRVTIRVPGVFDEESGWVKPWGTIGGGSPGRGGFLVPAKGATVGVMFVNGNPDDPRYVCGPNPDKGLPPDSSGGDPDTFAFALGGIRFELSKGTVDEQFPDGRGYAKIYSVPGNENCYLEIDGEKNTITVAGTKAIQFLAFGKVVVDAKTGVVVNGRPVQPTNRPI